MFRGRLVNPLKTCVRYVQTQYRMPDGTPDYLRMILLSKVYGAIQETPLVTAPQLSARTGATIKLKREDLLPFFSFKLRGAFNKIASLTEEERSRGVITASAGNHAQGVAYSASRLKIPATIVMPTPTPAIKYESVARLGAKVVLFGDNFDAAKAECARLQAELGLTYIPPFDDPHVIAGQGTIGMEITRQTDLSKLKAVFCGIGGGGLVAGIGVYLKRVAPHVKVIGVETFDADCMYQSLKAGKVLTLPKVGLFADGTAVREVGQEPFRLSQKYIDEIVHVNTDEICASINDIYNDLRCITEPSGALGVAAAKKWLAKHPEVRGDSEVACVLSGANMNFDRLRFVSERSRLGEGKEVFTIIEMNEQPNTLRKLVDVLAARPITEFSYRYNPANPKARVYISFSVDDRKELPTIVKQIDNLGMKTYDLSDNTLAKTHARYLVGGTPHLPNERVLRFQFPERPGALHDFLAKMKMEWDITLFHYRNGGADIGNVLIGICIPEGRDSEFNSFLESVGYPYIVEDNNIAYDLCLK